MVQGRYMHELVPRALDMLFVQCFKAHQSTYELAILAQLEDAATIVRRLLELAVQAVYIGHHPDAEERERRAGAFLAFMWLKWPVKSRGAIPTDERDAYEQMVERYGSHFKPEQRQWGPSFGEIFAELEAKDFGEGKPQVGCRQDYRYLSNVAHGSPPYLVHTYAQRGVVSLHDDRHVPALLLTGASYAVLGTAIWNEAYRLIPDPQLEALAAQIGAISAPQRRENGGDETEAGGA